MTHRLSLVVVAFVSLLLPFIPASAADYPSKSITLICPYSAGGGGDTAVVLQPTPVALDGRDGNFQHLGDLFVSQSGEES